MFDGDALPGKGKYNPPMRDVFLGDHEELVDGQNVAVRGVLPRDARPHTRTRRRACCASPTIVELIRAIRKGPDYSGP